MSSATELIDDLWRIHTGNLCLYLHGVDDMFRPDFDDPNPEVKCEIVIDAPREKVFAALVTPARRSRRSTIVNRHCVKSLRAHRNGEYFLKLGCDKELKLSRTYRDNLDRLRPSRP